MITRDRPYPNDSTDHRATRRAFLGTLTGGVLAPALLPGLAAADNRASRAAVSLAVPRTGPDEAYWEVVRSQFPLRDELTLLNAANLCPSPFVVSDVVREYTRDIDVDPSFQNRAKFSALQQRSTEAVARYVGADVDEIAITRNTSEGNNIVVGGLALGPGDEVVLWDENHPTNNVAWDVRAQRYGFTVKRVARSREATTPEELTRPFIAAITPQTRVLAFSHVSNASGVAMPAALLCAAARQRGVLTLVDGAQTFGALALDLHAMGCDFYTASTHKWLMGPKETGILYVRKGNADRLWPGVVSVGWEGARDAGARRLSSLGQRDDAALVAVGTAIDFHERIGKAVIEERVRQLAAALKNGLRSAVPGVRFVTPLDPQLSAGVVIFEIDGVQARDMYTSLYEKHGIAGASTGGIRLCPHIYNTLAQIERVTEAVRRIALG